MTDLFDFEEVIDRSFGTIEGAPEGFVHLTKGSKQHVPSHADPRSR